MKKVFVLGLITGLIIASVSLVFASSQIQAILNDKIKVTLNGDIQEFRDETTNEVQYPITYKDRTYLPLRTVANLVGVNVDYDALTNTAMLSSNNEDKKSIKMFNNKDWVFDADYEKNVSAESYKSYYGYDMYYVDDIVVPYININSADAKKANAEIKGILDDILSVFEEGVEDGRMYFY